MAAPKLKRIKIGDWQQLFDDTHQTPYYVNSKTGISQWERPSCFPAFLSTSDALQPEIGAELSPVHKYIKTPMEVYQEQLLKRPARVQVDPSEIKKYNVEGTQEYNIWYDRYTGDHWKNNVDKELSETKCDMVRDCGKTKADKWDPEGTKHFFCIYFAKGRCSLGAECTFFHRIPTERDASRFDNSYDCFGRQRFNEHRQDRGGTGAFLDDCKTLYVGGIGSSDNESAIWRGFGEWGTPKKINIVKRLNIAFVSYNNRLNAEFAKQAMAGQALDGKELLNIRWAYEDPNPKAQAEKLADWTDDVLSAAEQRGLLEQETDSKRRRLDAYPGQAIGYYPLTVDERAAASVCETKGIGPSTAQQLQEQEAAEKVSTDWDTLDNILNEVDKVNSQKAPSPVTQAPV
eukprot:m.295666 g.295666  ORF g.295666 m.295666 type:complete len:402 (+) comp20044_c1_seq2:107-1312(+)